MARLRISLRVKLALAAVALLSVPWAGAEFVSEMERFLLDGQEQALVATARAVATARRAEARRRAHRVRLAAGPDGGGGQG